MKALTLPLDHVVIAVADLDAAMNEFRAMGFTVSVGGQNGPTHNALVPFQDGTYLELICPRSWLARMLFIAFYRSKLLHLLKTIIPSLSFRVFSWLGGPSGVCDFCLRIVSQGNENLQSVIADLRAQGVDMSDVIEMARTKPNQEVAQWRLAAPVDLQLPFFIEDITNVDVRVPSGEAAIHKNGVVGISRLLLGEQKSDKQLASIAEYFSTKRSSKKYSDNANVNYIDYCLDAKLETELALELIAKDGSAMRLESFDGISTLLKLK